MSKKPTDLNAEMSEAFAFEQFSRDAIKLMAAIKRGDVAALAEFNRILDKADGTASSMLIAAGLATVGGSSDYTAAKLIFHDESHPAAQAWLARPKRRAA